MTRGAAANVGSQSVWVCTNSVYVHAYMCVCVCACVYVCVCVCTCMRAYMRARMHVCVYKLLPPLHTHMHTRMYTSKHKLAHSSTRMHAPGGAKHALGSGSLGSDGGGGGGCGGGGEDRGGGGGGEECQGRAVVASSHPGDFVVPAVAAVSIKGHIGKQIMIMETVSSHPFGYM